MHRNQCKVRSGSPVPDRVKSKCEPPREPLGGCPPAALKRCCQYEQEPPPLLLCKPMLPPFYETDKQKPSRKEDKCCPCCLQPLPPPKPESCGPPCPPQAQRPSRGQECGSSIQHKLMGGGGGAKGHCHEQGQGAHLDECGQPIPVPASKCNPMPEHHQVCPPYSTDLPCAHEIESQCLDGCSPKAPPCWVTMSMAYGQQGEQCPSPCLQPRLPPCPPACTPGLECVPDNRGALRPDKRDCPALGRNFCVHEPAKPRCPGTPAEMSDCEHEMVNMLVNAAPFQSEVKGVGENRPYCVTLDYQDMYCGMSATHFPMYCATSSGLQKKPPGEPKKQQRRREEAAACPATDPCCAGAGLTPTFVISPDSCCGRPCVPDDPPDRDVARRVGGFRQSMPSPTCWI